MRRKILILLASLLVFLPAFGQADRHEVRAGNRKFNKKDWRTSEIDYRKALLKDSLSVAGNYNLASSLYRQEKYDEAAKAIEAAGKLAGAPEYKANASAINYNEGAVALQKKDYAAAVKAFRESLLRNPSDLDAKENYIYAKKKLEDQQNQQNQQNQDQNQDQQQNQKDQKQDQQQDQQNQNKQDQQQKPQDNQQEPQGQQTPQEQKISPQQAQQMLSAIQAQEKKTQDKVNKEKAAVLKSRQKDKNW